MGVQINGDTGNISATKADYSGNVTIGGTLTYEDVTNIDSVGLVTARSGIEVGARPGVAASISVDGNMIVSGISTFGGALSGTTGTFSGAVSGTTGTFSGAVSGSTGTFTGDVDIADKIVHTGDTDTAIRFPSADTVRIDTAGSNRFKIDSSGRIGILDPNLDNFDSSADDLVINGAANTGITINSGGAGSTSEGNLVFAEGNGSGGSADGFRGAIQYKHGGDVMKFYTNNTERMRLRTSTGGLMIGEDGTNRIGEPKLHVLNGGSGTNVASFFYNTSDDRDALLIRHNGASGGTSRGMINFLNSSGNGVGHIHGTGSAVTYNSVSDYRLKENEVTIPDAISKVKQLKPYTFNFKADSNTTTDGFFAHEAQEVVPYAVTGEKDAEEMQSMDYGKLTPLLTAALQEAISEIETLKTEVAALKSQLNN